MATYHRGRVFPTDSKYIVHPHYATQAESSNEAIGHQVRTSSSLFYEFYIFANQLKTTIDSPNIRSHQQQTQYTDTHGCV